VKPQIRLDLLESALLCVFVCIVTWVISRPAPAKYESEQNAFRRVLAARYGPHESESVEEWLVRDYFGDRRGGVFVDIGASDYRLQSNTYRLETALGWSGLAVDALPTFAEGYRQHRPRTMFIAAFVGRREGDAATLYVDPSLTQMASADEKFTARFTEKASPTAVRTRTMDSLLDQAKISSIDFLSMDIELHEPEALAGFSIGRFRPALVCIEAHEQVRQAILEYFRVHHYDLVGKYLRVDDLNLWFTPVKTANEFGQSRDAPG
jgi:FkbM family methyltransferase